MDANIFVSAILKNGYTRQIITFQNKFSLIAPEFLLEELLKYTEEYCERLNISKFDLRQAAADLVERSKIEMIPLKEFSDFKIKADGCCPDPDDWQYFAVALKFKCAIWSNDKLLKSQKHIQIFSTQELTDLIPTTPQ